MKKTLLLLIAFFTITFASAQTAGDSFTDGLYSYVVQTDITQVFVSATTATGDVTFPTDATDGTNNYSVTGVAGSLNVATPGIISIIIPTGYKTFDASCFRGMSGMTSIIFNDGEVFGGKLFRSCASLETVVLPNTITSWGTEIFSQAPNLSSVDLGNCPEINNRMFRQTSVTELTLPTSITAFSVSAWNASPVVTLIVEGAVPPVIDADWEGTAANITAYVPTANITDYQNAAIWADMTIKDMAILLDPQVVVNTLADFRTAVQFSDREITLMSGNYNLEDDLPSDSRVINFSGSNNTIILTDAYIQVPVGSINESYILVTGNNNIINGGEIEDTYRNGLTEITDFVAYHQDSANLSYGLKGAAVMTVSGTDNLVDGLKLIVRGSHLYGYGSMYGINQFNTFGMNKRCGLLINGARNTLDNVEVQMRAFGHGIFMQGEADETVIKNSLVEGRVRAYSDLYNETDTNSFPFRSNYKLPETSDTEYEMPFSSNVEPIPTDQVFSLSEDGIRSYNGTGSVTVENCTVKKMRGGIRLYLGNNCSVTNSTAIDCGSTNFNMPSGGVISNSNGNFAYAPLSDFRLSRNNMDIEWTILPSPNAIGPHNLVDVQGSGHNIIFHRTEGPIDTEERAIVVTGNNSTITNETEYNLVLEVGTSGNVIYSCGGGMVTDNGTNNSVTTYENCEEIDNVCPKTAALMEGECYDSMSGIQTEESSEGGLNLGYIDNDEWVMFENIDLNDIKSVNARTASKYDGGTIEVHLGDVTGTLIATIQVTNRGGWQAWGTDSVDISSFTEGVYDVYFVFKSARAGSIFNINWFSFSESSLSVDSNSLANNLSVYPNPTNNEITVSLSNTGIDLSRAKITLHNINGKEILAVKPQNNKNIILDISRIQNGVYILRVTDETSVINKKIVKI